MIVTCEGTVSKKSESTAQMSCVVSTTGLAFSVKKPSAVKAVMRYIRRKVFFSKLVFLGAYDSVKCKFGKKSNEQAGAVVINGPPDDVR